MHNILSFIYLFKIIEFIMSPQLANISFTNLLDTDLVILTYIDASYLAYIKTINKYIYSTVTQYFPNKCELSITKDLICTPYFVKNNFNNFVKKEKWLLNKCIEYGFDLEGIKWLISKGCKPNNDTFAYAVRNGNLENMKWMLQNNFPKDRWTFARAAQNGNLENMKWMLQSDFSKDKWTFAFAADNGNLENMKWMLQNNFPKNMSTFEFAAKNGNLENMKWMLHNDFPKDTWTFACAALNGNLENMKWMIQNNFPYNTDDYNKYMQMINI